MWYGAVVRVDLVKLIKDSAVDKVNWKNDAEVLSKHPTFAELRKKTLNGISK